MADTSEATTLEAEPAENIEDHDSAIGSDVESTRSESLTSSITGYKYENGRRYHAYREGAYYLPNDEAEQARLDLLHHIYRLALDGALYMAPISASNIKRCLDFGTGTGIWAIDFADEFPTCEVIGTDLSPIQPTWVPPNLKFFVDDVESDWSYNVDNHFDFIHGRMMGGALNDWKRAFRQIYDNTRPGGFCEMHEYDGWIHSNEDPDGKTWPTVYEWVKLVNEASVKFGKEFNLGPKIKDYMSSVGFIDIHEKFVKIPIGPWAKGKKNKEMGILQREHICDCVDSYTPKLFTQVLGWSTEGILSHDLGQCRVPDLHNDQYTDADAETEVFMAKCKKEARDPKIQTYVNFIFTYGKKPA